MSITDQAAVLALLAERDAATTAGDAQAAVAGMAPDAISYDLPPPLLYRHDHDAAVERLNAWFATWQDGVRSELVKPAVRISGDIAVAWGLSHLRGDKKGEGAQDVWYRSTVVLERAGAGWRIVHEHHSFPLTMDGSGTAATDLMPDPAA